MNVGGEPIWIFFYTLEYLATIDFRWVEFLKLNLRMVMGKRKCHHSLHQNQGE